MRYVEGYVNPEVEPPMAITRNEPANTDCRPYSIRETRIMALRDSFPSLHDHFSEHDWDPERLSDWKNGPYASSGSAHAAAFVLHVWNHYRFAFDLGAAFARWDDAHRTAWQAWAAEPWFA